MYLLVGLVYRGMEFCCSGGKMKRDKEKVT